MGALNRKELPSSSPEFYNVWETLFDFSGRRTRLRRRRYERNGGRTDVRILMVGSEATPFGQTGGLGEVLSSLPAALAGLGVEVDVLMPKYRGVTPSRFDIKPLDLDVRIDLNATPVPASFWSLRDPRGVRYLFLENDKYYDRDGLYGDASRDYEDNSERFVFLARAAIEMSLALGAEYDVFHAHDWQAALTPVYLRTLFAGEPLLANSASVMTIHNLGYQGIFGQFDMPLVGVGWEFFNYRQMEFHGKLNFLKSGIVFADEVTTVSKGYRNEILTPEFGFGLEGVLWEKGENLTGILNGVDYGVWNPETDAFIAARYGVGRMEGKAVCKKELQEIGGLPARPDAAVIAMVSRLSTQKGIDMVEGAFPWMLGENVQLVVLGTGDAAYQDSFLAFGAEHPDKAAVFVTYDNRLAHKIFAGADILLVPSRYEPCGLNQLYALRYGTVPVVRATGGLNDTVQEYNRTEDSGTGFKFSGTTAADLAATTARAVELFRSDGAAWGRLMTRAMSQDFSWGRSASEYIAVYEKALARRRGLRTA
jgi:starch synthase